MTERIPHHPMRVRLKADGRLVEIAPDGRERELPADMRPGPEPAPPPAAPGEARRPASRLTNRLASLAPPKPPGGKRKQSDAAYARGIRAATKLTQAEFAARIGVPIETVRNWEQGKRAPRGPARALLRVIEKTPDLVFAALAPLRAR